MTTDAAPINPAERATIIDALRGFALLGVCVANINTGFAQWQVPGSEGLTPVLHLPGDMTTKFLLRAFVDGKFYSLFSLLFGLGFALQLSRKTDAPTALGLYRRRLMVLMVIGFLHLQLLWLGDILFFYALMGLILLRMRHLDDQRLLRWVKILAVAPVLFYIPGVFLRELTLGAPFYMLGDAADQLLGLDINSKTLLYDYLIRGGWREFFLINADGLFWRFGDLFSSGRPFKVLAMFLLGLLVGRHRVWERLDDFVPLLKRILFWGLAVGLPASLALATITEVIEFDNGRWNQLIDGILYALGVIPLALAYAAGFALLWRHPSWRARLSVFAPTGRMALTNYLMQTVIAIIIFYGIGFRLGGRVTPSAFPLIAIAIVGAQTLFSKWWLARYRFGPMEWVWRSVTYRKRQVQRVV